MPNSFPRRALRFLPLAAGLLLLGIGASAPTHADEPSDPASTAAFQQHVTPFLKRNCLACHNKGNPTAGVNFSRYASAEEALSDPDVWEKVAARLINGTMPPKGLPRPPAEAQSAVLNWIHQGLERAASQAKPDPGRVTARRLNRFEYNNTVRHLLGVDFQPAADFPADDSGYGFDNIGDVLTVSPILMEKYVDAAWDIAQLAVVSPLDRLQPTTTRISSESVRRLGTGAETATGPLAFPGTKQAEFLFPTDAEYEILVRVADRRKKRESPGLFAAVVGNGEPQAFAMEAPTDSEEPPNEYTFRTHVPAGRQLIRAATVNDKLQPHRYADEEDPKRFIDIAYFEVRGPFGSTRRAITDSHRALFVCNPQSPDEQPACAERILRRLARLAYRRPVTNRDLSPLLALAAEARHEGLPFEEQVRLSLQAVLVSPHFLFRIERDPPATADTTIRELTQVELASRLSYFLWSSMPDEALLDAAEQGRLATREQMLTQVRRMMADPKSKALTESFAGQWLQLRNVDYVQPDRDLFPEFDAELRRSMKRETELVFEEILRHSGKVRDFLTADYTYLNERLARHYGISGITGDEFRKVPLDTAQRSGILTHGSILTISSYPTRTSPVLRGLWLLENILGAPPPPPPPDVPELDAEGVGEAATLRERMERHRSDPTCAACHSKMDPLGFGLENYDAIGRYREAEGRFPIDASGVLPDGSAFDGPAAMKQALMAQEREIATSLARKMLTFALGRGVERFDRPAVESLVGAMESNGYTVSTLVEEICWSMPFRMRRMEQPLAAASQEGAAGQ